MFKFIPIALLATILSAFSADQAQAAGGCGCHAQRGSVTASSAAPVDRSRSNFGSAHSPTPRYLIPKADPLRYSPN